MSVKRSRSDKAPTSSKESKQDDKKAKLEIEYAFRELIIEDRYVYFHPIIRMIFADTRWLVVPLH